MDEHQSLLSSGFSKLQSKDVLPVVVVSLLPPLLVAVASTLAFYCYRSRQAEKPDPPARSDWPPKQSTDLLLASELPCGALVGGEGGCVTGPGVEQESSKHPTSNPISNMTHCPGQVEELLPIKLEVLVGKGRFAEVWMGRSDCHGTVAVKVFPAVEYASWRNERSIFSDPKMEHGNIVRFHAAEERGPPGHALRQYWLILAYHSLGNLQDFLTANVLSWEELVAMAGSIAKGLAHLHSDTTPGGLPKVSREPARLWEQCLSPGKRQVEGILWDASVCTSLWFCLRRWTARESVGLVSAGDEEPSRGERVLSRRSDGVPDGGPDGGLDGV